MCEGECEERVNVRGECEGWACEGYMTYYGGSSSCVPSLVRRRQCCDGIVHKDEPVCAGHTVNHD